MVTGELLGSGRTADVYALDGGWVLRRYRDGLDASGEADVMAYLNGRGYPVPEVRAPVHVDCAPGDLVMRRLTGPTMVEALLRGEMAPAVAGAELAGLLRRLHAVPSRASEDPRARILHLDLHPGNVILTADGPMVIDWSNTEEGDPALDWAMSALILAQAAVGGLDIGVEPPVDALRTGLTALLAGARVDVSAGLAEARARRADNPTMSAAELGRLGDAVALVRESLAATG
jgi:aminoglycoside phosphotransferase (APT) family kinase protein